MPPHPTIALIGAGAVGGYYGCRLAQAGNSVHFLLRSDYDAVARAGWTVRSIAGDFALPPGATHIYRDPRHMPKADLVIVALKATANDQYEPLITPLLKPDTAILTLQNGLGNEDRLAGLFGPSRILGGLAFVCLNRVAPGVIHHLEYGFIRLGEFSGPPTDRTRAVASLFNSAKVQCDILDNLRQGRWEKLIWNIPFNGIGGVADIDSGRLVADGAGEALIRAIMTEVIAAARADGVILPDSLIDNRIAMTKTMGPYMSSMQLDRRAGREMEVEAILGEAVRVAERAGVGVPLMRMVYVLAKLAGEFGVQPLGCSAEEQAKA